LTAAPRSIEMEPAKEALSMMAWILLGVYQAEKAFVGL
jgi:hypothetical protein